jgi:hypothetical protein
MTRTGIFKFGVLVDISAPPFGRLDSFISVLPDILTFLDCTVTLSYYNLFASKPCSPTGKSCTEKRSTTTLTFVPASGPLYEEPNERFRC